MMAQEAFAKMDQHLDLFTRKEKLMSWSMKDLTADYSDILDQLTIGSSKILDGVQWSRTSTHLYRKDLICVPKDYEEAMLEWAHKTDGHPGVERTLWFFQKYFFAKSSDASLKKILSKIIAECPCTKAIWLSTKLVTGFWYITQDSRHGLVTRWTALTSDHFWSRM